MPTVVNNNMRTFISFCYVPHTAFASRNRQYGAYSMRQSYTQHLWTGFLWGTCFVSFLLLDWVLYENVQVGKTKIIAQEKNTLKTVVKEPSINFNFIPPPPEAPDVALCRCGIELTDQDSLLTPNTGKEHNPIQNVAQENISETIEPLQTPLPTEIPPKEENTYCCTFIQKNAQFVGGQKALGKFLQD
ncbi:MAG: hypothetical protein EAZ95_18715, partial [Bacteroidetes bacterium]